MPREVIGIADVLLSLYLGASQTAPSNLHVVQAARGNDTTLHGVTWRGYPFRFEVYYGARLTYRNPHSRTDIAIDFTHAKVYADSDAVVHQDGTWHSSHIDELAAMRSRVQSFEMTHGMNMLGILLLERVSGSNGIAAGGGPVFYIPHTESRVDGAARSAPDTFAGTGFQWVAGVRGCTGQRQVYAEIKYSDASLRADIADGYAELRARTTHELAGAAVRSTGC